MKIKMTKEQKEKAKQLCDEHWAYISLLLTEHGIQDSERKIIGFHYKSAMFHGIKHGVEDDEFRQEVCHADQ